MILLWKKNMSEIEDLASCVTVEDEEMLRLRYASPRFLPVLDQLDRSCKLFIAHAPIVIIGTTQPGNGIDISPGGFGDGQKRRPELLYFQAINLVELVGIEPTTSSLRTMRSPS